MMDKIFSSVQHDLKEVDQKIKGQLRKLCRDDGFVDKVFGAFFGSPGKKLRPSLTLLSAFAARQDNMASARDSESYGDLISLATITELVHSASLMHDDVLDGGAVRRGRASINFQFGNKMAILAGDILYSHAFEMLIDSADRDVIVALVGCVKKMCSGEITNLCEHDFESYKEIIEDKTASLMEFSCWAGACWACGDAGAEIAESLKVFGHRFGMLYQLLDDMEDLDEDIVVNSKDRIISLAGEYMTDAKASLTVVPDSIYKASLAMMLNSLDARLQANGATILESEPSRSKSSVTGM